MVKMFLSSILLVLILINCKKEINWEEEEDISSSEYPTRSLKYPKRHYSSKKKDTTLEMKLPDVTGSSVFKKEEDSKLKERKFKFLNKEFKEPTTKEPTEESTKESLEKPQPYFLEDIERIENIVGIKEPNYISKPKNLNISPQENLLEEVKLEIDDEDGEEIDRKYELEEARYFRNNKDSSNIYPLPQKRIKQEEEDSTVQKIPCYRNPPSEICNDLNFTCSICMEGFSLEDVVLICRGSSSEEGYETKHIFHDHCINDSMTAVDRNSRGLNTRCPNCRLWDRWEFREVEQGEKIYSIFPLVGDLDSMEWLYSQNIQSSEATTGHLTRFLIYIGNPINGVLHTDQTKRVIDTLINNGGKVTKEGLSFTKSFHKEDALTQKHRTDLLDMLPESSMIPEVLTKSLTSEAWDLALGKKTDSRYLEKLIEKGADPNGEYQGEISFLEQIVNSKYTFASERIIKILVKNGADSNITFKVGSYSDERNFRKIVALLDI